MRNVSRKPLQWCLAAVSLLLIAALAVQVLFWTGVLQRTQAETVQADTPADDASEFAAAGSLSHEGYELEQVVVLSRHNIRSPLSGNGSVLGSITSHEWFAWSSKPSELSLRR